MKERTYLAVDLKSFFASVECVERGLDPLTTNLVVADAARTEKTICLAVSPSLKAYGIPGRPRLFEVVQQVATVNVQRRQQAPGRQLTGKSFLAEELWKNPTLAVDYIVAQSGAAFDPGLVPLFVDLVPEFAQIRSTYSDDRSRCW